MRKFIFIGIYVLSYCAVFAQYDSQLYSPLTAREMNSTFPIKYVGTIGDRRPGYFEKMDDRPLPETIGAGISGVSISHNDEELFISGTDRYKKPWKVTLGVDSFIYATRLYVSDLDKNGIKDLVMLIPTGGNGLAPTSHLCTLTFDRQGKPVPFRAEGYFEDRGGKIFDLVDLNRDGRAELIYANYDDGYWITSPYMVRNALWRKVTGKLAGRTYPLYVRFTTRENHRAVRPVKGRNPYSPELSNTSSQVFDRLESFEWAKVNQSKDISLNLVRNDKVISARPVSRYSTSFIVIDRADGREAVSLSANEETVKRALNLIQTSKSKVGIYGRRKRDTMSPDLLWAGIRK